MEILTQIVLATLAGGALSVLVASTIAFGLLQHWVSRMVSFAVGIMLGTALLDLLPEAVKAGLSVEHAGTVILVGLFLFFVLEKLVLWHHHHTANNGGNAIKPAGPMVLVGDGVHNFVDGVLTAAAFLQDTKLGIAIAIAVIAHEIPQEVGDFMVLLDSGFTRRQALVLNLLSSLASLIGGVLGYFVLHDASTVIPYALALAAASFIYIALVDLVPELHRGHAISVAPTQLALIVAGICAMALGH